MKSNESTPWNPGHIRASKKRGAVHKVTAAKPINTDARV